MAGRLIAVSNRTASGPENRAGGLAVALWDALVEAGGGLWFGWSGDITDAASPGLRHITEGSVTFALADLTEEEHEGFYLGHANRALWPLFHYRVDLARFDEAAYETYRQVNRRFARLLSPMLREDDLVWVHDYHFLNLGKELRDGGWAGRTGFFLHIPFPAPEIFKALPDHHEAAGGLAAYDVVGFQTKRDAANFTRYLVEDCGAEELDDGMILVFGRQIEIRDFPIGVDAADIAALASSKEADTAVGLIERYLVNRALILGVDRMDYSKGLPQRFAAFADMLDGSPDLHGAVSFVQIAPPSRTKVEEYAELRAKLDELAGRVNGDYGDLDWIPVRYLARGYDRASLTGLYRRAAVGLVTPLMDGMNLVAKEFVAAQLEDDPGVLILSEFAGAAEQLEGAMLVNPHDAPGMSAAIRRALEMPVEERRERWRSMQNIVATEDIAWWRKRFMSALERPAA